MSGHGWVTPNPDGSKARCGGLGICIICMRERTTPPPSPTAAEQAADEYLTPVRIAQLAEHHPSGLVRALARAATPVPEQAQPAGVTDEQIEAIREISMHRHPTTQGWESGIRAALAATHPVPPAGAVDAAEDAWISVDDRLPDLGPDEEGVQVWTWDGEFIEHDEFVACYEQPAGPAVGGWMRVGDWFASDLFATVTHWRPYIKPEPPRLGQPMGGKGE